MESPKPHDREQEQSIKDRKALLYDDDPSPDFGAASSKPFRAYLRDTPPSPLSLGTKAILWALALVVALLLIGAAIKWQRPKTQGAKRAEARPKADAQSARDDNPAAACRGLGPSEDQTRWLTVIST